eukprot:CAMPEP_0172203876 /NCGR_PEP_ID=MMETSP1050-20130122/31563_1 /TAXON_ID=233186 /ORGANISM="Cryptomonas curvata, Strain CCAP979/52" /LENGTH=218 /DNA_ID=CAMNT_0012882211 /DNA_START=36 /DNA_END=689 /DNA_ORIENTATION=+
MERVAIYIQYDIEQGDEVQEQQKLLVTEFGLLDSQVRGLKKIAFAPDESLLEGMEPSEAQQYRYAIVDPDELAVVAGDVEDLARRVGLEELLGQASVFPNLMSQLSLAEVQTKVQDGARFYLEGTRLIASDVVYALTLLHKALSGNTLQPREVRTLRRTAKDLVTFIPFIIILIIPLTPVGHVLVFSFIQRFFPDFFPSPYTDRRQNLLRMYQSLEMP